MYSIVFRNTENTGTIEVGRRGPILPPADFCVTKCVILIMGVLLVLGISILIFNKYINALL